MQLPRQEAPEGPHYSSLIIERRIAFTWSPDLGKVSSKYYQVFTGFYCFIYQFSKNYGLRDKGIKKNFYDAGWWESESVLVLCRVLYLSYNSHQHFYSQQPSPVTVLFPSVKIWNFIVIILEFGGFRIKAIFCGGVETLKAFRNTR